MSEKEQSSNQGPQTAGERQTGNQMLEAAHESFMMLLAEDLERRLEEVQETFEREMGERRHVFVVPESSITPLSLWELSHPTDEQRELYPDAIARYNQRRAAEETKWEENHPKTT